MATKSLVWKPGARFSLASLDGYASWQTTLPGVRVGLTGRLLHPIGGEPGWWDANFDEPVGSDVAPVRGPWCVHERDLAESS